MLQHIHIKHPAHMIFTRDFHELVRGRFERGIDCTISYDPVRIVPEGDPYMFGDPNRTVVAHIQFVEGGPVLDLPLESWVGLRRYIPKTFMGEGPMLKGVFEVPDEAELVIMWFTFAGADGQTHFDSERGENYHFRFVHEDFKLLDAVVTGEPDDPLHSFELHVEADERITRIVARYRVTNVPGAGAEQEAELRPTDKHTEDGCRVWTAQAIPVPCNAVVAFDLGYLIEQRWVKIDNQGNYYLATHPDKLAQVALK